MEKPLRVVVCAACKLPDSDLIFCGPRHFDSTMWKQIEAANMLDEANKMDQGFIDQYGEFMNREEAMIVAKNARQPIDYEHGCGRSFTILYSEGLY